MPSLRMKTKSSVCCLREKTCLRVCHKSSTISKKTCSHAKISELDAESVIACHGCQDVSPSCEFGAQDTETVGAINSAELPGGQDIKSDQLTSLGDSQMSPDQRSTDLETIFSPTLNQIDVCSAQNSLDSAVGIDVDRDLSCLGAADESDGNSGSSSEYQTCNISDFYVSDMVLAGFPFDGGSMCDDIAETLIFPEYDSAETNFFFDVTERHIPLPFLDVSAETNEMLNVRPSEEARMNYDNSSFLFAIHQICPGDKEADLAPHVESDEAQYFDPHSFIRNLPDLSDAGPNGKPIIVPKESLEKKRITLVLDLDETLVHSSLEHCEDADFTFTVFFNTKEHTVYVKERPHLRSFLKKVAEMFEIVIFTASQSIYAEQLLDILDPDGKLISGRAYRESCIFCDGSYTKDLTVLGLDLAKVVIIDNSPQVFRLQVNNGIPIKSWFDDPSDTELISLLPFLETLANTDDVRPHIAQRFGNKE